MKMADLSAILATPIAAIIDGKRTHKPLGHIAAHESITALYDVFRHNDVGGVFVYKTIEKDGKTSKEYIAIITILQVMSYFADIIDDLSNLASSYLLRLIRTTTVEKVLEALGGEGSRTWVAPEGKVSLAELMEVLSGGISRVLVPVGVDGDGETMYDVCTHRDVLLYLYHNFDNDPMLQTQADSNLLDLGLTNDQDIESSHSTVISVGLDWPLRDALRRMTLLSVRTAAVLSIPPPSSSPFSPTSSPPPSSPPTLISTLSLSTFRRYPLQSLTDPSATVRSVLLRVHGVDAVEKLPGSVTCTKGEKVRSAVAKCVERGVGRVWVVAGDSEEVVDVVSLADLCRGILGV